MPKQGDDPLSNLLNDLKNDLNIILASMEEKVELMEEQVKEIDRKTRIIIESRRNKH